MITPEIIAEHGLSTEEYDVICTQMGRVPNLTELGVFSVMWSEHCSYKSSRFWLKKLPTSGKQVIQGPGENAGIVDIGDGDAAVFKMESHNHPSFIEPYQGAATGVGGIMRDVFTMGARPIANLNALRFGAPDHHKTRHLVSGVVAGIGGYGNCIGVPTVGGEVNFDASYNGNILVNAMCVGLAKTDKIFYAAASGIGNPVVYIGSKTGRDGIHGATMASTEFDDSSEEKRPTVQVGDPFTEKLLLEACLELMASDAIIAIQDMGAAGLTSSSVEMASKGGVGIMLDLDKVPCREENMTAYEMLLSESQERMLMVLKPGREKEAEAIFHRWGLDFAVIGKLIKGDEMQVYHKGEQVASLPLGALGDGAPEYERKWKKPKPAPPLGKLSHPLSPQKALLTLIGSDALCSRRWIWEQYDHMVMGDTMIRPGSDSAVIRVHGTNKGIAVSTDVTPRYCHASPLEGGRQAVAETWRNLIVSGAKPLAITNCLNFGNPEREEIMGQFVQCLQGMGEACKALNFPVVSGNVSLYNETNGEAIMPTPAIGGVGVLESLDNCMELSLKAAGDIVLIIGESKGHLGSSLYAKYICKAKEAAPPPVNLAMEHKNGEFVREIILQNMCNAAHDISDGGAYIALAEMSLAGNQGAEITADISKDPYGFLFGEDQARYLLSANKEQAEKILQRAEKEGVFAQIFARAGGEGLTLPSFGPISLQALHEAYEGWFPHFMRREL